MHDPHPDLWRAQGARLPHLLWDMVDGPMPSRLLGIGDPDIHLVDRRWTMFLGGFSTNFHDRLYRATLLDGGTLAEGPWQVDHDARGRTAALVVDPPRAAWHGTGMHTPSYVPPADGRAARIYYTGRSTRRHYGPGSHTRSASWSSETVTGIDGTTRFSKEGLLAPACWNPSSFTPRVATACGTRPPP